MRKLPIFFLSLALAPLTVFGHGDNSHFHASQDINVRTVKITDNVYMLQGRGGNIGVLTGPEGLLIVDDDYRTVSEKLSTALKELGSPTPRFILNTHWHGDHTEGNNVFGKTGTIIAHDNVRKRLIDPPMIFGSRPAPYPAFALPILTYAESITIHLNGEEIKVVHYPSGHTDGDSIIFFKKANVVHLGDDFFVGRFPFVDLASGGNVQGLINNVAALIQTIPADAKLIPGHGPLASLSDLKEYHSLVVESAKIVQDGMKAGKTIDEIKSAGFPEKFKEAGSGFIKTDMWIEIVYQSYSAK
ncbi:MAG: MBL fold metallo-hydrolase [Blastocatellia bacterium]|nr:MBL fold metallo-hydrolase [Blastocatellia bacterium]